MRQPKAWRYLEKGERQDGERHGETRGVQNESRGDGGEKERDRTDRDETRMCVWVQGSQASLARSRSHSSLSDRESN